MRPKQVTILGSTGSVGVNTLNVIRDHPEKYQIYALSAASSWELLFTQVAEFKPLFAVMTKKEAAVKLAERLKAQGLATQVMLGDLALCEVASAPEVDIVMAAIVGAVGLSSCMAAAYAGKRLLLANKEALVIGGDLFMQAVSRGAATLIPIDSEHSAIFQSLPQDSRTWDEQIRRIILTASGGPFLNRDLASFSEITPQQACAHPNWVMGQKISVDSATMMNKALEVIEARYLFGVGAKKIEVVIHPQSIIHSMVEYHDASVMAQLGTPDMRMPISYGLAYPERIVSGAARLNFYDLPNISFIKPDEQRFPSLSLAWQAMSESSGAIVLNAANEVAVDGFLQKRLRFDQIYQLNAEVLQRFVHTEVTTLEQVQLMNEEASRLALQIIPSLR